MKQKFNLALRPLNKSPEIIAYAKQLTPIVWQYQLGEFSLPHVTLYQFYAEPDEADALWQKALKSWQPKPITLQLTAISNTTYEDKTLYWVSLLPDQREKLFKMHELIASIIEHPLKLTFDPHVTLANTRHKDFAEQTAKLLADYTPLQDEFILTLGRSDQIGQYTQELHSTK